MILVCGGTGTLGSQIVRRLLERGEPVRILTRDLERIKRRPLGLDLVCGDLRDGTGLAVACEGMTTVVAAAHGFTGGGGQSPATVDWEGNRRLIEAAQAAGVERLILISVVGAGTEHPMELFRMKARAEEELRRSSLAWTIIRATAFMETWLSLIGEPLRSRGKTRVFGGARNPINFVSAWDVAEVIDVSLATRGPRRSVIEIGGPEDLSLLELARSFQGTVGCAGSVSRVPLPLMRAMLIMMRRINPTIARQVEAGIVMDTHAMTFAATQSPEALHRIGPTRLADAIRRDYVDRPALPSPQAV